jgi:hypothetical protein
LKEREREREKEIYKSREGEEENVGSYWKTLIKREET